MALFEDAYTNEQLRIVQSFQENAERLYRELLDFAVEARDAIVQLPYTNERGNAVVHGCNREMGNIAERYHSAARELSFLLSHEEDTAYTIATEKGISLNGNIHEKLERPN